MHRPPQRPRRGARRACTPRRRVQQPCGLCGRAAAAGARGRRRRHAGRPHARAHPRGRNPARRGEAGAPRPGRASCARLHASSMKLPGRQQLSVQRVSYQQCRSHRPPQCYTCREHLWAMGRACPILRCSVQHGMVPLLRRHRRLIANTNTEKAIASHTQKGLLLTLTLALRRCSRPRTRASRRRACCCMLAMTPARRATYCWARSTCAACPARRPGGQRSRRARD